MIDFRKCEGCSELDIGFNCNPLGVTFPCTTTIFPKCKRGAFYVNSEGMHIEDEHKCICKDKNCARVTINVTGCNDCPFCTTGYTYGNDGRDGRKVYVCKKGAFGNLNDVQYYGFDGYATGPSTIPKYPNSKCPIIKSSPIRVIASRLDISEKKLKSILESENCEIIFKK